jgi:hypothetical protein
MSAKVEIEGMPGVGENGGETVEVAHLLDERRVGDLGRMIVLLKAAEADSEERGITERRLQSIAYILSQKGTVPIDCWFRFIPLPFSDEIDEGFIYMQNSGYVSREILSRDSLGFIKQGDKLWLTEKGKEWVSETLQEDESRIIAPIRKPIQELNGKNDGEIFEESFQASQIC